STNTDIPTFPVIGALQLTLHEPPALLAEWPDVGRTNRRASHLSVALGYPPIGSHPIAGLAPGAALHFRDRRPRSRRVASPDRQSLRDRPSLRVSSHGETEVCRSWPGRRILDPTSDCLSAVLASALAGKGRGNISEGHFQTRG